MSYPAVDLRRNIGVAVSVVVAVAGAFVGSGAAGGTPIQDAAGGALAADATLLAPAGAAFSIWSVIYAGLIAYTVWQFFPSQRSSARQRRLGVWAAASLILNAAWILSIQFDALALSVPIIAVLVGVLARIFVLLVSSSPSSGWDALVTDGTFGLYLGWVMVATVANVAAVLVAAGFDGAGLPGEVWSVGLLVVVAGLGILLAARGGGRVSPMLSLCWGLGWIAAGRLNGEPESWATGGAAIAAAVAVLTVTVFFRWHARRGVLRP